MSTGVAVGLVALLVLGGGAVAYAVTRKPADPLAPPDPSVGELPAGAAPGVRSAQAFGEIGLYEGPRVRAMRGKDPYRGDVRPPRAQPDNPKTLTVIGRTRVQSANDAVTRWFGKLVAGDAAPAAPPVRPPTVGWA